MIYFFAFLSIFTVTAEIAHLGTAGYIVNPYLDFSGWNIIGDSVARAARAVYPEAFAFTFSFTPQDNPKLYRWDGLVWNTDIFLSRLVFILVAVGIALLSAALFDRFNPSQALPVPRKKNEPSSAAPAIASEPAPASTIHLTPLAGSRAQFRFDALFIAELKLFIKGQPWWWYAIAAGPAVAPLFTPSSPRWRCSWAFWPVPVRSSKPYTCSGCTCSFKRHSRLTLWA